MLNTRQDRLKSTDQQIRATAVHQNWVLHEVLEFSNMEKGLPGSLSYGTAIIVDRVRSTDCTLILNMKGCDFDKDSTFELAMDIIKNIKITGVLYSGLKSEQFDALQQICNEKNIVMSMVGTIPSEFFFPSCSLSFAEDLTSEETNIQERDENACCSCTIL